MYVLRKRHPRSEYPGVAWIPLPVAPVPDFTGTVLLSQSFRSVSRKGRALSWDASGSFVILPTYFNLEAELWPAIGAGGLRTVDRARVQNAHYAGLWVNLEPPVVPFDITVLPGVFQLRGERTPSRSPLRDSHRTTSFVSLLPPLPFDVTLYPGTVMSTVRMRQRVLGPDQRGFSYSAQPVEPPFVPPPVPVEQVYIPTFRRRRR